MSKPLILITGASSGIGRASAILLSNRGFDCIISGRDQQRLSKTYESLHQGRHMMITADLTDASSFDTVAESVSKLDGILHCAGVIKLSPYKFIKRTDFQQIININLLAPFFLTQSILKKNKLNEGGSIVFISSISGSFIGSKGNLMYSCSKSAVDGMIKTLALELAPKKIRVNSVNAGMVKSEMWNGGSNVSKEQLEIDEQKYPLGYGNVEDVAECASFLLSNSSKWITGSSLVADGGVTIQ